MRSSQGRPPRAPAGGVASSQGETLGLIVLGAVIGVSALFLAGSHLAAWTAGGPPLRAGLVEAGRALWRLPTTLDDPAAAWGSDQRAALPGPVAYYACLAVLVFAAAGIGVGTAKVVKRLSRRRHPLGVEPNAGLADARALRRLVVRRPRPGRLTLGRVGGRLVATEPQVSLAVIGPSGCGKSAGFAIPALLEWQGPVIATSVKTDLVAATLARRRQLGEVWVFDPARLSGWLVALEPARRLWDLGRGDADGGVAVRGHRLQARLGHQRGLLVHAGAQGAPVAPARGGHRRLHDAGRGAVDRRPGPGARARGSPATRRGDRRGRAGVQRRGGPGAAPPAAAPVRAEVLDSIRQVLRADSGRRGQLADEKVTAWPVEMQEQFEERVAIEVDRRLMKILEARIVELARNRGDLDALVAVESLWAKEERLRGSVYATVQNVLLTYADPAVASVTERCDIDFDEWLDDANTVYIVATADEQDRLRPVLTVIIQQAIRRAYEAANIAGGTLDIPCLVLLDEAGNIVPLKDLPGYASTARSHGISLVTIWQDLAQIEAIYGHRASTVLNNHKAKIFGTSIADAGTLDYVSKLVGDEERTERNFSTDLAGGPRRSVSEHTTYRRLLPMDVIRRMPKNQGLLLYGSDPAAHLHLRPWHVDRRLKALAGPTAPRRPPG